MELSEVDLLGEMPSAVFALWHATFMRLFLAVESSLARLLYYMLMDNLFVWNADPYLCFLFALCIGVFLHWVAWQCLEVSVDRALAEYVFEPEVWDRPLRLDPEAPRPA
jgi:hypothetical protein